jgi:hypothetical protein
MTNAEQQWFDPAWPFFLALGAINVVQGSLLILFGGEVEMDTIHRVTGMAWGQLVISYPSIALYINNLLETVGLFLGGFGLLIMAISATGYRRARKWSWYAMWLVPAFYSLTAYILYREGEFFIYSDDLTAEFFVFMLIAAFAVQLLSYRSFKVRGTGSQQTRL